MGNFVLVTAILAGVWGWHRRDFRPPRVLERVGIPPRRLVIIAGSLIVGVTVLFLLGDIFGGYTARNLDPGQHVHRSDDPRAFWLQLLLQLGMYAGTGMCLIAFGRSKGRLATAAHQ